MYYELSYDTHTQTHTHRTWHCYSMRTACNLGTDAYCLQARYYYSTVLIRDRTLKFIALSGDDRKQLTAVS